MCSCTKNKLDLFDLQVLWLFCLANFILGVTRVTYGKRSFTTVTMLHFDRCFTGGMARNKSRIFRLLKGLVLINVKIATGKISKIRILSSGPLATPTVVSKLFWSKVFFAFSACGGLRTGTSMPVLTAWLGAYWERVDCSWHHH